MIYLLDTNTCIAYLRAPTSPIARRLAGIAPQDVVLSAITVTELYRGAHRSAATTQNLALVQTFISGFACLPLDVPAAEVAGWIDATLAAQGLRIGPYDTLIAAIALTHNLILVTHNTGEFRRVAGLQLDDWHAP